MKEFRKMGKLGKRRARIGNAARSLESTLRELGQHDSEFGKVGMGGLEN